MNRYLFDILNTKNKLFTISDSIDDLPIIHLLSNRSISLFKFNNVIFCKEAVIPRTIKHESNDYLITSISDTSNYIRKLKFNENSAVKTSIEILYVLSF